MQTHGHVSFSSSWWSVDGIFVHYERDGETLRRSQHEAVSGRVAFHNFTSEPVFQSRSVGKIQNVLLLSRLVFDAKSSLIFHAIGSWGISEGVDGLAATTSDDGRRYNAQGWGFMVGASVVPVGANTDKWASVPAQVAPRRSGDSWCLLDSLREELSVATEYGVPPADALDFAEALKKAKEDDDAFQSETGLDSYSYQMQRRDETRVKTLLTATARKYDGLAVVERCGTPCANCSCLRRG